MIEIYEYIHTKYSRIFVKKEPISKNAYKLDFLPIDFNFPPLFFLNHNNLSNFKVSRKIEK
jgi:hypothetical protein